MSISITDTAAGYIRKLSDSNGRPVRLRILSGGCQGFLKQWSIDDQLMGNDKPIILLDGHLVIDEMSADLISPAVIDLQDDLSGSVLTVSPSTAGSTCGCGASFSI